MSNGSALAASVRDRLLAAVFPQAWRGFCEAGSHEPGFTIGLAMATARESNRLRTLLETGIAISSELSLDAVLERIIEANNMQKVRPAQLCQQC